MYRLFYLISFLLVFTINCSLAQQGEQSEIVDVAGKDYSLQKVVTKDVRFVEYRNKVDKVIEATEIVYYGLDLIPLVLTNWEMVGLEDENKKYIPAWIKEYHIRTKNKNLIKLFGKGKENFQLVVEFDDIQSEFSKKNGEWISSKKFTLSVDDIVKRVDAYQLEKKEGIGFVIIGENFNTPEKRGSALYTFFDIETREILWMVRAIMRGGGWGLTEYWSVALEDTFIVFKGEKYEVARKNNGKFD